MLNAFKRYVPMLITLATTVTIFANQTPQYNAMIDLTSLTKPTQQYISSVKIIDKYGNLPYVKGKWEPDFNHMISQGDKKLAKGKTVTATRYAYNPVKFTLKTPQDLVLTIEPSATKQVTMGKVIIPEELPKDNWWINVQKPGTYQADVILKVKEDGTFKFLNLPNGTYNIEIYRGTHVDGYAVDASGCMWDKTHAVDMGTLEIKGNINKTFDLTNKVTEQLALADYFKNTIDYNTPSKYLNITPHLELDEATKKFSDEKVPVVTDIVSLEKAIGAIRTKFQYNFEAKKTDLDLTAQEIIKQGYLTGCTQTATLAQAVLEYKGVPTTVVSCVDVDWAKRVQAGTQNPYKIAGHEFLEVFVGGKWVLIDPTGGLVYANYKVGEPSIFLMPNDSPKFYPVGYGDSVAAFDGYYKQLACVTLGKSGNVKDLDKLTALKPTSRVQINE